MIYYKIRSKTNNELYVKGTPYYFSYDKSGRVFQSLGRLRSFLTGVMNNEFRNHNLSDWEVVELEMIVTDVKPVVDVLDPKKILELLSK